MEKIDKIKYTWTFFILRYIYITQYLTSYYITYKIMYGIDIIYIYIYIHTYIHTYIYIYIYIYSIGSQTNLFKIQSRRSEKNTVLFDFVTVNLHKNIFF